MIGVLFYNKRKYKNKYLQFRDKWVSEKRNEKVLNGSIIILTIIFSWCLIFINLFILKKIQ